MFTFSCGILEILDPVTATLSWDPRDLESQTERMLLDPGNHESCLGKLSWDFVDLGSCTTIMPLYLKDPLYPLKFFILFPIALCCLNLSSCYGFQPHIDSTILCWLENKLTLSASPRAILNEYDLES